MNRIHSHFILLTLLILFEVQPLFPQEVIFNRVPAPEEQPWPWMTGITQDPHGFMWFASVDGLYRHDGLRTNFYKYDPSNPNSISSNILTCIHADKGGAIWIGSFGGGLDRFDPARRLFSHYRHNAQKVVDKIFQPFFTTNPTGQGTGLGLSLSYDIIKAHGGEIKVETKEGEGSEFVIQLPMK